MMIQKLKQSIATTLQEDIDIKDKKSDLKGVKPKKVQKNSAKMKKNFRKRKRCLRMVTHTLMVKLTRIC